MNHRFEASVRRAHDHLYANANVRNPEGLSSEVAKMVTLLVHVKDEEPALLDRLQGRGGKPGARSDDNLADGLRRCYSTVTSRHGESGAFELDDESLVWLGSELAAFDYADRSRDFLGDALETMRSTTSKRLGGQFFTDQRVTDLAVHMLEYDPAEHDFVDICAGSGGFLISAAKSALRKGVLNPRIVGVEVDEKVAGLADSNLRGLGLAPNWRILTADSLRAMPQADGFTLGSHRRLASNPPFGNKITVKDNELLSGYALGRVWHRTEAGWKQGRRIVPRPPDILFLERNLMLAEPGSGRVAIVTPYQMLSGPRLGFAREWLLRNARVLAVVDLPDDTFQPWTGTKAALLFCERRSEPLERWEPEEYPIFMATPNLIGHDRRGHPVVDSAGAIDTDLPAVGEAWEVFRSGGDPSEVFADAFAISASEVTSVSDMRLNAAFYHPRARTLQRRIRSLSASATFRSVRLGDEVARVFCPGRFKRAYVESDADAVLFLGGSNITQFVATNRKYLSKHDPRLEELIVREGWILVTRSGSTGVISRVPSTWDGLAVSEHVIRIVPKEDGLSADYLETFLRSHWGRQLLAAGIFGSVIDEITPEHVSDLYVPVPKDTNALLAISDAQASANDARDAVHLGLARSLSLLDELFAGHLDGRPQAARNP